MKTFGIAILLLAALTAPAFGQQWEFGGVGGLGFLNTVGVGSPLGAATAGFGNGAVGGAFFGQNLYSRMSGEIHYEYLQSNLKLTSGGQTAQFNGTAQAIHYDLLLHTRRKNSPVQLFVAFGGGMKIFQGTGAEAAYQPLNQYGYFTRTRVLKPMASVGAGATYALSHRVFLRTEFRDFITAFPTNLIAPAPGTKYGKILQDYVPMVGLDYLF